MCSTPYGIKGKGTLPWGSCHLLVECAQRLTASKVKARLLEESLQRIKECSTPYGIKGKGTKSYKPLAVASFSCSTPYGIKGKGTNPALSPVAECSSAQRLTASKVKARIYCQYDSQARVGAQRLTASKVKAQQVT